MVGVGWPFVPLERSTGKQAAALQAHAVGSAEFEEPRLQRLARLRAWIDSGAVGTDLRAAA